MSQDKSNRSYNFKLNQHQLYPQIYQEPNKTTKKTDKQR